MNTWNLLIICSTAVLLGLLWAVVVLAAADKASKAMHGSVSPRETIDKHPLCPVCDKDVRTGNHGFGKGGCV